MTENLNKFSLPLVFRILSRDSDDNLQLHIVSHFRSRDIFASMSGVFCMYVYTHEYVSVYELPEDA